MILQSKTGVIAAAFFLLIGGSLSAQTPHTAQLETIEAPAEAQGKSFARSVALHGDTLLVSAPGAFDSDTDHGLILQMLYSGSGWELDDIIESPSSPGALFGFSISRADSILVVGAPEAHNSEGEAVGAAYVYYLEDDGWELRHTFMPEILTPDSRFGHAVAADSGRVIVGAPQAEFLELEMVGRAFGYDLIRNPGEDPIETTLNVSLPSENERFGWSVDIRGMYAILSTQEAGIVIGPRNRAFIFDQSTVNTGWTARQTFHRQQSNNVFFGYDVAIAASTAFVGHPREQVDGEMGSVYKYEGFVNGDEFEESGVLTPSQGSSFMQYGQTVETYHDELIVGSRRNVEVFRKSSGGSWNLIGGFFPDSNDEITFTEAVDLNNQFVIAGGYTDINDDQRIYWQHKETATSIESGEEQLPETVQLHPAYPNPFNPVTNMPFTIDEPGPVQLEVFDVSGRLVRVLARETYSAGTHTVPFDASGLGSGIYYYRLTTGSSTLTRSVTLVK